MTTVETVQVLSFTGKVLQWQGTEYPATCIVRNELNGWRQPWQVVRTMGSTRPHGLAYYPRPFPAGTWEVLDVADMGDGTEYWPTWIGTDATQELAVWDLDIQGMYRRPTGETFTGRGYGLHHARYRKGNKMVPSNTTIGCINILSPTDARVLGMSIREAMGYKLHVVLDVPPWDEWEG